MIRYAKILFKPDGCLWRIHDEALCCDITGFRTHREAVFEALNLGYTIIAIQEFRGEWRDVFKYSPKVPGEITP